MKCPTCGQSPKKTNIQRNKFHAMCRELGLFIGETPGKVKAAIKQDFYGIDEFKIGNKWYREVRPSEQSLRDEYSELIDHAILFAAANLDYVFSDGAGDVVGDLRASGAI